jgi:hypothetical protein
MASNTLVSYEDKSFFPSKIIICVVFDDQSKENSRKFTFYKSTLWYPSHLGRYHVLSAYRQFAVIYRSFAVMGYKALHGVIWLYRIIWFL